MIAGGEGSDIKFEEQEKTISKINNLQPDSGGSEGDGPHGSVHISASNMKCNKRYAYVSYFSFKNMNKIDM